jgi:hypothetical protein
LLGLLLDTVQGLILGLVLYAIFILSLFEMAELFAFADDNFIPSSGTSNELLVSEVERILETVMKASGLKTNNSKTEACLFFRKDCAPVILKIGEDTIKTNKILNVLVFFNSKLQ